MEVKTVEAVTVVYSFPHHSFCLFRRSLLSPTTHSKLQKDQLENVALWSRNTDAECRRHYVYSMYWCIWRKMLNTQNITWIWCRLRTVAEKEERQTAKRRKKDEKCNKTLRKTDRQTEWNKDKKKERTGRKEKYYMKERGKNGTMTEVRKRKKEKKSTMHANEN